MAYNRPQQSKFNNFQKRKRDFDRPRDHGFHVHVNGDTPEALTKAMRKLKKRIANDGLLQTLRDRQYYRKPSEIKREAKKAGRKRWEKIQAKMKHEL